MFETGPSNPLPRTGDAPAASQEGNSDVQPLTDLVKGRMLRKVRAREERAVLDEACASVQQAWILGIILLPNATRVAMI